MTVQVTSGAKKTISLIFFLLYIALSSRMAHYYTDHTRPEGKKIESKMDYLLIEPLDIFGNILAESEEPHSTNTSKQADNFISKGTIYINFFAWPFLVLMSLIFWIAFAVMVILIMIAAVLGAVFSVILWVLTKIFLASNLF